MFKFFRFFPSFECWFRWIIELSTAIPKIPFWEATGMEDELFIKKLVYPYEIFQIIESIKKFQEEFFSTLKQLYSDDVKQQGKPKLNNGEERTMMHVKDVVLFLTDIFQNLEKTCKFYWYQTIFFSDYI